MFFSKSEELNNKHLPRGYDIFFYILLYLYSDYELFEIEINCNNQFKETFLGDYFFIVYH